MYQRFAIRLAAFAVAIAFLPIGSTSSRAQAYDAVMRACDNDNQRRAGSCQKQERQMGVLHGCAGNVCFVCPADSRRQCFPATPASEGGVLHANLDVPLTRAGVNVEAVVKACDFIHEHNRPCNYTTGNLPVLEGTAGSGARFQCVNRQECHPAR